MSVARREVHEFQVFMGQKSFKIDLREMVKNFPADFEIYGVSRHDKPDYEKISGQRRTELSQIGTFLVNFSNFGQLIRQ